jgi:coproporphyrinogen III oxidase
MDNWDNDFEFVKDVGLTFVEIIKDVVRRKMFEKFTKKQKEIQLLKRGRYVEYNLLYDRGTKFGLNSGGNIDAILMSMPPNAKWK